MSVTSFLKDTFVKSIGSGFPTIVLNGGPGLPYKYLYKVLEPFSGKNNCLIFYDQLGCGASKVEDKYINLENNLIQLSEVIDYYVWEDFNILTHSWGNWLALEYLRTKSSEEGKSLNKIIAISPIALNNIALEESFQYVKNNLSLADKLQLEQLMSSPTDNSQISALELIINNLTSNSERLYSEGQNNLITTKSGNKFVFDSFSFKIAKHIMNMLFEGYDHKEIVYNSTTKIDFILGGQDPLPRKEIFEAWEENPEFISRVEIPEVGHLLFLEDPETFDVILGET